MSAAGIGRGIALLAALAFAGAGGYWFGGKRAPAGQDTAAVGAEAAKGQRKVLYYRNPMGLPDISQTPKKDSMGMDYIPVYEGDEEEAGGGVKISTAKVQRLGVRSVAVEKRTLDAVVRATGRVEVDERRLATITPKFEGYVEKLFVNAPAVRRCSRRTAPSCWPPSASTRLPRRGWRRSAAPTRSRSAA